MTDATGKRLWIFANGEVQNLHRLRDIIRPGDAFIAADGGYRYLAQLGLVPALVIGDLDSLLAEEIAQIQDAGIQVERYPIEKDETDLELALKRAAVSGYKVIRVAGALGGRFDQSLGNLFLISKPEYAYLDLRLDDGVEEVFLIRDHGVIFGTPGDTVSLLPLGKKASGITTHGLKYALTQETLFADQSRGISNVMLTNQAQVDLTEGMLICVHRRNDNPS